MKLRIPVAAAVTLLVACPAAASADDASLFNAYVARQATEVNPAGEAYLRASKRAQRSGTARAYRAVVRADERINRVLGVIEQELAAQVASTRAGQKARAAALAEVRAWAQANRYEIRALRAWIHGRHAAGRRWIRRANRTMRRTARHARVAVGSFRHAGFSSPAGAISRQTKAED